MHYPARFAVTLLACFTLGLFNTAYAGQSNIDKAQQTAPNTLQGKVTDIIEVAGYTYAEVDTGKVKVWAATASTPLKTGDTVAFTTEMPMKNFHSKSINRDFPVVYFVSRFIVNQDNQAIEARSSMPKHPRIKPQQVAEPVTGINKIEGGYTIDQIYAQKISLNNKTVRARGQVTKITLNVLGRNWLHIRDSSTLDDLTITSDNAAAVDDIVVIEGRLSLDKDFGYGYVYPVIVEDATLTQK